MCQKRAFCQHLLSLIWLQTCMTFSCEDVHSALFHTVKATEVNAPKKISLEQRDLLCKSENET